jgi:hypothetical protein
VAKPPGHKKRDLKSEGDKAPGIVVILAGLWYKKNYYKPSLRLPFHKRAYVPSELNHFEEGELL